MPLPDCLAVFGIKRNGIDDAVLAEYPVLRQSGTLLL